MSAFRHGYVYGMFVGACVTLLLTGHWLGAIVMGVIAFAISSPRTVR